MLAVKMAAQIHGDGKDFMRAYSMYVNGIHFKVLNVNKLLFFPKQKGRLHLILNSFPKVFIPKNRSTVFDLISELFTHVDISPTICAGRCFRLSFCLFI